MPAPDVPSWPTRFQSPLLAAVEVGFAGGLTVRTCTNARLARRNLFQSIFIFYIYILYLCKTMQNHSFLQHVNPPGLGATDKDLYCFSGSCTKFTDSCKARQILLASSARMSRECKRGATTSFLIGRLTGSRGPAGTGEELQ